MIKQVITFIFSTLLIVNFCNGQKPVEYYKNFCDSALQKHFSKSVFDKVCTDSYFGSVENGGDIFNGIYPINKDKIIKARDVIIFYELYSKELDHEFYFSVNVHDDTEILFINSAVHSVPECVRFGKLCKYISKDRAINIAIKDSIPDNDNLLVEFLSPKDTKEFYWVVSSQKKFYINYNTPMPIDGWAPMPKRNINTRCINACTGKLVKYEDFVAMGTLLRY